MAVNLIVLAVTMLVAGFVAVWLAVPGLRPWMEMPKHRFLHRQRRFPDVDRGPEPAAPVASDLTAQRRPGARLF